MRTAVVLPVKRFDRAKHRLAGTLAPEQRHALMGAMLADVLAALATVRGMHELIVVTAEPAAARAARAAGAHVVDDPLERGHSEAAGIGIAVAEERDAERVLLIPADCPLLDPPEVERLMALPRALRPRMVIVADRAGQGTNALLLEPPRALAPAFGPGSFARHCTAARRAGLAVQAHDAASLSLDVDTPDDLVALRAAQRVAGHAPAPRTAALLERLAPMTEAAR